METLRLIYILIQIKDALILTKHKFGIFDLLKYIRKQNLITDQEHFDMIKFFELNKPTTKNRYKEFHNYKLAFFGNDIFSSNWFRFVIDKKEIRRLKMGYLNNIIYNTQQESITTGRKITILKKLKNIIQSGDVSCGICSGLEVLYQRNKISLSEHQAVSSFIKANKPTVNNLYKEFMENRFWIDSTYWWSQIYKEPETVKIRANYLSKLISNIK